VTAAERAIRWSTIAAVAAVAVVAGWVSYLHAYEVVSAHGESGLVGRLYPGTVDGLIYAASMVLLDAARRAVPAPILARWLLAAGIGATLFANVLAGAAYGPLGAAVAAWPALALVGAYELLMLIIRGHCAPATGTAQDHHQASAADAAITAYRAAFAAGSPMSQRALAAEFSISRRQAARLVAAVTAESSGHASAARYSELATS
jgi:hypothetical protein